MKFLLLKKIQKTWKQIIALFMIAMSVTTLTLFTPSNHPAQAFLGAFDTVLINIQEFVIDLAESFATNLVEGVVKQESSNAINGVIKQYHIGSYLQYATNLKNQVYAAQAIADDSVAGKNQLNQYIVKAIISDIDGNPVSHLNLSPLYQKAALNVVNINNTDSVTIGTSTQNFLAQAGSFAGNSGGQYFLYADLAQKIDQKASYAAYQDIESANGYRSTYDCSATAFDTGSALTDKSNQSIDATDQLNCALQNPGNYVGDVLAGNIDGLFNRGFNPPNNHLSPILQAIAGAAGNAFAGIAQQQLIGGSKGGTLVSSTISINKNTSGGAQGSGAGGSNGSTGGNGYGGGTGAPGACDQFTCVLGASNNNYGTLFALDSSGNVIAGSGTSVSNPVANKSSYTIEWNAAGISGAHYVAFAPCSSAQCSGAKDKKDLSGSFTSRASGAIQTYTLQVWGMDENGNETILETDTIAIKIR